MFHAASAFFCPLMSGAIDQNSSHGLGRGAEKMCPVGKPCAAIDAYKLQPGIVYQRSRLQSVVGCISRKLLLSHPMQLGIDQVEQLLPSFALTTLGSFEEPCHIAHVGIQCSRFWHCHQAPNCFAASSENSGFTVSTLNI